jgi:hypothetical protein
MISTIRPVDPGRAAKGEILARVMRELVLRSRHLVAWSDRHLGTAQAPAPLGHLVRFDLDGLLSGRPARHGAAVARLAAGSDAERRAFCGASPLLVSTEAEIHALARADQGWAGSGLRIPLQRALARRGCWEDAKALEENLAYARDAAAAAGFRFRPASVWPTAFDACFDLASVWAWAVYSALEPDAPRYAALLVRSFPSGEAGARHD